MSCRLWCMLHRPFHLLSDSGDAPREAGRRALRATEPRQPLPDLRPAGAPCGLRQPSPFRRDVRHHERRGTCHPHGAGACHRPAIANRNSEIVNRKGSIDRTDPTMPDASGMVACSGALQYIVADRKSLEPERAGEIISGPSRFISLLPAHQTSNGDSSSCSIVSASSSSSRSRSRATPWRIMP